MNETDYLSTLVNNLFTYLTDKHFDQDEINIIRKHNNKLDSSGELSFPLNISAWKKFVDINDQIKILHYINNYKITTDLNLFNDLIDESKKWNISVIKCNINNEKLNIFLERQLSSTNIIKSILIQQKNYGSSNLSYASKIEIQIENEENNLSLMDLTQLRINLVKDVILNLLQVTGNFTNTNNTELICLTNKSKSKIDTKKIVCGVVISNKFGKKNTDITAEDYYTKRTIDMRLMAQHKYGVRVNSDPGWAEFFEKLGKAAVIIDLLHVKPSRSIVINMENATSLHSKGASFILYNCARLATIFKQFDQKVTSGVYPPLPEINQIDFVLLNQPEEWEILYVYLMQYPDIVKSCVKDICDCRVNIHNLCTFLDSMCSLFSIYYRRIRILIEPRVHLFPVLYARIYFLKAVQEVLHNALAILNIPPVKQM